MESQLRVKAFAEGTTASIRFPSIGRWTSLHVYIFMKRMVGMVGLCTWDFTSIIQATIYVAVLQL